MKQFGEVTNHIRDWPQYSWASDETINRVLDELAHEAVQLHDLDDVSNEDVLAMILANKARH
jgi:hypothetical protein